MKKERWGDPQLEDCYDDLDLWEMEQIVINGELTSYGERLYEEIREYYYDEIDNKWIII